MQESSGSFVRCKSWPKLRAFLMIFNLNIAADALLYIATSLTIIDIIS